LKRLLDPKLSTEGRCKTQCRHGSKIRDSAAFVAPRIELALKSRPNEIYRSLRVHALD
jgi:hypothetical protein